MNKVKFFFKSLFNMKNWKRWLIISITFILTILSIVFGSVFSVSKNINKSIEYGGGISVTVQVRNEDGSELDPKNESNKELVQTISRSLQNRLTGGIGLNGITTTVDGNDKITVQKSGVLTSQQISEFKKEISKKPILTVTDINLRPIFVNGKFNDDFINNTDYNSLLNEKNYSRLSEFVPPLEANQARANIEAGSQRNIVDIQLISDDNHIYEKEWTKATKFLAENHLPILMWLNLDELREIAITKYKREWENAQMNPYRFVYVNEQPNPNTNDPNSQNSFLSGELKKNVFDAELYLISVASVSQPLTGNRFNISGNFTQDQAKKLALDINYGVAPYKLEARSEHLIPAGAQTNFDSAIYAGLIVFLLISLFMIFNYGLFGLLSALSIGLYIFFTLLIFQQLGGEYSPATIASLIIGIGLSVDANIITYERFKSEIKNGESIVKSNKNAYKFSLSSILDANITTLIVSFILFFFGSITIKSFSISLILSITFTLLVMLLFNKFLATLLAGITTLQNKKWLFGIYWLSKPKEKILLNRTKRFINYFKLGKVMFFLSFGFIFVMLFVYMGFAIYSKSFGGPFSLSLEFTGGTELFIEKSKESFELLSFEQAQVLQQDIINRFANDFVLNASNFRITENGSTDNYALILRTVNIIPDSYIQYLRGSGFVPNNHTISPFEASELVKNAILAISLSFIGIIIYTLFRMRWTYSIGAIIALIHDSLFVLACILMIQVQVSPIIIAAILSIVAFSINDTIVIFDRIREVIENEYSNIQYTKEDLRKIINTSVAQTIKRSILTSLTTILSVVILLIFKNASNFSFNIIMLFGLTVGTYSSIFIATQVWYLFEKIRINKSQKRMRDNYWKTSDIAEQVFPTINDFKQ
ncbi:protein translocase subunit SecDF [Mycoplasma phocimorsus]|uniref:protein translocase subunit SecDF n=1 Tax=Mycoplasma phocimorsus TaxID=3045839 RepID=UPI0024BF436E|nr:protein translocase subunit SecDF [Mycoplasma phocimorsus]MDJ1646634.1 protein translocase subunit SecDF [Mycoplasma phocimorsus]